MSNVNYNAGYEALPDGPEAPTSAASAPAPAGPPSPARPPAVLAPSQAVLPTSAQENFGASLPESSLEVWDACSPLMAALLGTSASTLVVCGGASALAACAALCGLAASGLYFYSGLRGAAAARAARAVHWALGAAAALAAALFLLAFLGAAATSAGCTRDEARGDWGAEDEWDEWRSEWCESAVEGLFFLGAWMALYAALAAALFRRVVRVRQLLNPVSSGAYMIEGV